ncbi:MAG: hypothetical protein KDJ26_07840 [Alphaproteobacteria bacterium]|nr:hypothetical protein [Alphaproteobacteria bacterium]
MLKNQMSQRIDRSKQNVFMRGDFEDLGHYDQIGRALHALIKEKMLIRIGHGLYAKAKKSSLSGKVVPVKPLPDLAKEALERLGFETAPSRLQCDYNAGKTTQVPTGRVIGVKGRVKRKIGYDGIYVSYERV